MKKYNWLYATAAVAIIGSVVPLGAVEPSLSPRAADQVIRKVSGITEGKLDRRFSCVPPKLRDQEPRVAQGSGQQPGLLAAQRKKAVPPKMLP